MPTASSVQSNRSSRIIPQIRIRFFLVFTFRKTNSIVKPLPKSKTPAIRKSIIDQLTSLLNCIAINGINNSSNTIESKVAMFFGFANIFFVKVKKKLQSKSELFNLKQTKVLKGVLLIRLKPVSNLFFQKYFSLL